MNRLLHERRDSSPRLREIPEIACATVKRLPRGKYAAKARRSFELALVEPARFAHFGSSEAINAALQTLVDAAATSAKRVERPHA